MDISGVCSHQNLQHFLLDRRRRRCCRKESSPSCSGASPPCASCGAFMVSMSSSGAGEMQQVKAELVVLHCEGKCRCVLELWQHFCLERARKGWSGQWWQPQGIPNFPPGGLWVPPLRQLSAGNNLRKDLVREVEIGCGDHGLRCGCAECVCWAGECALNWCGWDKLGNKQHPWVPELGKGTEASRTVFIGSRTPPGGQEQSPSCLGPC